MTKNAGLRGQWRRNWLGSLRELSDMALQRETWLNDHNSNPHYCFIEFVNSYLYDLTLYDGYEQVLRDKLVTSAEVDAIMSFDKALLTYQEPVGSAYNDSLVLSDPAWACVTAEAREAIRKLSEILNDPSERAELANRSESALAASLTRGKA